MKEVITDFLDVTEEDCDDVSHSLNSLLGLLDALQKNRAELALLEDEGTSCAIRVAGHRLVIPEITPNPRETRQL